MCAKWIEPKERFTTSGKYIFKTTFESTGALTVKVSASTRYKLYVNNVFVLEGPCQGTPYVHYYEEANLSAYLKSGKNELVAEVLHIADEHFTSVFTTPAPTLWLESDGGVETDGNWEIYRINGQEFYQGDLVMYTTGSYEKHTMPYVYEKLTTIEGKDAFLDNNSANHVGALNPLRLEKSLLPQMATHPAISLQEVKRTENQMDLDAGKYITAKVKVAVKGKKGDTVKLTWSECYVQSADFWTFEKTKRDDATGFLVGPQDEIVLTGETQEIDFFWYRAFRFVGVSCKNLNDLDIRFTVTPYYYPLDVHGKFTCSDEQFNKMWQVSLQTLLCCSHEIVVDCPYFEQQQYQMDSYLEAMYLLKVSNETRLVKKMIVDLSHSQQPNGLLCANYPSRIYQIIPGFSFYWILLLHDYFAYSKDVEFIKPFMGTLDKILCYFDNNLTKDGLVKPCYWPYLDWAGDWENGVPHKGLEKPTCVYSMLYSMGLKCAAEMAIACDRSYLAMEYEKRRFDLNAAIKKHFWNAETGYYNDALTTTFKSQHTAIWAILAEIETGDAAKALAPTMLDKDTVTCSFSMGFFLFRALEKTGMYDKAFPYFDAFRTMLDLNCTTWCENPDSPRSECHAWSATPLYEFARNILGVKMVSPGFDEVEIKPNLGHLTFAEGTVPTPHGDIFVRVDKTENGVNVNYKAPDSIEVTVKTE